MSTGEIIAKNIRALLKLRGITQTELADKTGLTEVSISRYCSGNRVPRADTIVKLCRCLGVTADYLLGMEE